MQSHFFALAAPRSRVQLRAAARARLARKTNAPCHSMEMAKYNPGITPPSEQVIDGILYQQKINQSPTLQLSNQNRAKMENSGFAGNSKFANLDRSITQLDAQFDALPNQADWNDYAANIDGEWALCANCTPMSSGKKLFRQYNWNRFLLGKPTITVPIDNTESAITQGSGMVIVWNSPGMYESWWLDVDSSIVGETIVALNTYAFDSPPLTITSGMIGHHDPADATLVAWAHTLKPFLRVLSPGVWSGAVNLCWTASSGAPGVQRGYDFEMTDF